MKKENHMDELEEGCREVNQRRVELWNKKVKKIFADMIEQEAQKKADERCKACKHNFTLKLTPLGKKCMKLLKP